MINTKTNNLIMTFKEIQDLIKMIDKSTLSEFSYKTETYEIKIKGQQSGTHTVYASAPTQAPMVIAPSALSGGVTSTEAKSETSASSTPASTNLIEIKSPMVGTFYRSPGPDKPVFVNVGDNISKGSPVCIIEAMKLFNEIESEFTGKIVKVMVEDASPVEYDQVLFLVEP